MDKKIAIVTGGSRGIGRAISVDLAENGYHVIFTYRSNIAAAEETEKLIQEKNGTCEKYSFDIGNSAETKEFYDTLFEKYKYIDVLVNNAGIAKDGLFLMLGEDDWNDVIDTSLKGFYNMTKPVLKKMIRKKKGAIVTISSISGLIGNRGQSNYSAAKAGLIGASRSVSTEVARLGIRMNVVAPGLIETDMIEDVPVGHVKQMIPMARIGKPEEVASLVRFLCSDDASYITGQVISINVGMF
jgi:3-oxoacyl-[acyl-carrier protein] reductase